MEEVFFEVVFEVVGGGDIFLEKWEEGVFVFLVVDDYGYGGVFVSFDKMVGVVG